MTPRQLLKQFWGHDNFRPMQEEIIMSVLDGKDVLALLPTGGGKSVCFQVPALAKEGICIVVSPLIALMKDQVENLKAKGIEAMSIVSGMNRREVDIALDNCVYGFTKFLYLSPERLLSELVRERIKYMNVNLIAVDEAHCISQWGYDFRPPYLHIADLRELHPNVPILALTASATADVKADIQQKLMFRQGNTVYQQSFNRKNISYVVQQTENKLKKLLDVAHGVNGSGIVYVRTRKDTVELARFFNDYNISAGHYHAGLAADERAERQEAWKNNRTRIIVATNAFGMGIDKPDVRFVVHNEMPDSLEAYYQEAGRGGRDEQKAYAVLLYNNADKARQESRFMQNFPSAEEIRQVYHQLGSYCQVAYDTGEGTSFDLDLADFCSKYKLDAVKTLNALKVLEQQEYLSFNESVYLPSRFRFEVLNEELYNFQIQNPGWDPFVKTLLRSYGGAFENYVRLKEFDLARRTGMSTQQVIAGLQQLNDAGLLSYLPQTDKPQLTWIKPRLHAKNLYLNKVTIEERKAAHRQKMEAVFAYASHHQCRSQMLLGYFGEENAPKCGMCDVCLDEKRRRNADEIGENISAEILEVLSAHPVTLAELVSGLKRGHEKEKIDAIRSLLDAGKIKSNGERYYL